MEQEQIFNKLIENIEANKRAKEEGKVTSVLFPFKRLSNLFPGWERGHYYCVTAATSVGKTKLTKFLSVISVYKFIKEHPEIDYKIMYFALEESKEEFWLSMISSLLYEIYSVSLSLAQLKSLGNYTLSNETLEQIKQCKEWVDDMSSKIEVVDHVYNPYGIYKVVHDFHLTIGVEEFEEQISEKVSKKYIPNNPNLWVFVIIDHLSLLTSEKGQNQYETIGHFSKHYCLKHFVKKLNCVTIAVQQQDMTNDKQEFYQGQSIDEKLEPSIPGLANCKETARDYHFIMGLFSPIRYNITRHRGYDIKRFRDKYVSMKILKDRHYGLANAYIPLYFNGATTYYEELPEATVITEETYKNLNI
jgi:replicative DNA helicase